MHISVVIPTYNVLELLKQNLPHVVDALIAYNQYCHSREDGNPATSSNKNKSPDNKVELIISDNHSSDSSLQFLKEFQAKSPISIQVLENNWNGGFAVNVNRGLAVAKGEIIILLGTDVKPSKDFIKPLLSHFADEKVFAVGCVNQSDQDHGTNILRGRGIGKWEKGFLLHNHGELINDNTLWVDCGGGAFRKSILDKIGFLQGLYAPFYWEDVDLSYRAQKMGYTVKIEKKSLVIHEHKKGSIKKEKSDLIKQTVYRNQFFFTWLNITDKDLLLNHILYLPYHLLTAIKSGNIFLLKGFFHALMKYNEVLSERKKIVPKFKITDKAILAKFKNKS